MNVLQVSGVTKKFGGLKALTNVTFDMPEGQVLGVIGPKGMPRPIVAKLADAFKKAMNEREFLEVMKKFDMPSFYADTEDYAKYLKGEFESIEKLVMGIPSGVSPATFRKAWLSVTTSAGGRLSRSMASRSSRSFTTMQ